MRLVALGAAGVVAGVVAVAAVPALAEWTERGSTVISAQATSLREPLVDVSVSAHGKAVVTATAPRDSAPPQAYAVTRDGASVCEITGDAALSSPVPCEDNAPPLAGTVRYSVTSSVGSWTATSDPIEVHVPPGTPTIDFASDADTGLSDGLVVRDSATVRITAGAAIERHRVVVTLDGAVLVTHDVEPGGSVDVPVALAHDDEHLVSAYAVHRLDDAAVSPPAEPMSIRRVPGTIVTSVVLSDRPDLGNVTGENRENRYDIAGRDEVRVNFSAPVDPSSICAGWDGSAPLPVTVHVQPDGRHSLLSLSATTDACTDGVRFGSLTIARGGMNPRNPTDLDFSSSTLVLSEEGTQVTVSLGPFAASHVWRVPNQASSDPPAVFTVGPMFDQAGHEIGLGQVIATGTF